MWENLELSLQRAAEAEARQIERLEGCMQQMPHQTCLEPDVAQSAPIGPDDFALPLQRLPKGHAIATTHAEAVLLDRMYLALEAHYDRVLFEECQHSAEVEHCCRHTPHEISCSFARHCVKQLA